MPYWFGAMIGQSRSSSAVVTLLINSPAAGGMMLVIRSCEVNGSLFVRLPEAHSPRPAHILQKHIPYCNSVIFTCENC